MPAENLITDKELALWASTTESVITADEFAQDVIAKMSDYARFLGFGTGPGVTPQVLPAAYGWQTLEDAPFDVRLLVLKVCRRTYENVREVIQEGNLGPIGGDRVRDAAALAMELTETEREILTKYNPKGDPELEGGTGGGLWVQPTFVGDESLLVEEILYVGDNLQVNLEESADPREWKIPLFNPGDPGSPARYDDED
jgi:hypothetical protein